VRLPRDVERRAPGIVAVLRNRPRRHPRGEDRRDAGPDGRGRRHAAVSTTEDVEEFIRLHHEHGQLVGDATEPTLTGYRVTISWPCSVTCVRHVTAGEAVIDLAMLARRN
jgi:hypothetical protein